MAKDNRHLTTPCGLEQTGDTRPERIKAQGHASRRRRGRGLRSTHPTGFSSCGTPLGEDLFRSRSLERDPGLDRRHRRRTGRDLGAGRSRPRLVRSVR